MEQPYHTWNNPTILGETLPYLGKPYHTWRNPTILGETLPYLGKPYHTWRNVTIIGETLPYLEPPYHTWSHHTILGTTLPYLEKPYHTWRNPTILGETLPHLEKPYLIWNNPTIFWSTLPYLESPCGATGKTPFANQSESIVTWFKLIRPPSLVGGSTGFQTSVAPPTIQTTHHAPSAIHTDEFALAQQLQMGPEDVARVVRNVAHKLRMGHATQGLAVHAERADIHTKETKLPDRPLNPMLHMDLRPVDRVCHMHSNYLRQPALGKATAANRLHTRTGATTRRRRRCNDTSLKQMIGSTYVALLVTATLPTACNWGNITGSMRSMAH